MANYLATQARDPGIDSHQHHPIHDMVYGAIWRDIVCLACSLHQVHHHHRHWSSSSTLYFENVHFFHAVLGSDVCPYEVPPHIPEYCPFRLQTKQFLVIIPFLAMLSADVVYFVLILDLWLEPCYWFKYEASSQFENFVGFFPVPGGGAWEASSGVGQGPGDEHVHAVLDDVQYDSTASPLQSLRKGENVCSLCHCLMSWSWFMGNHQCFDMV